MNKKIEMDADTLHREAELTHHLRTLLSSAHGLADTITQAAKHPQLAEMAREVVQKIWAAERMAGTLRAVMLDAHAKAVMGPGSRAPDAAAEG